MSTNQQQLSFSAPSNTLDSTLELLAAQKKLQEATSLLNSHQCDSKKFEIAYWQEHHKLAEILEANGRLNQDNDELRGQRPRNNFKAAAPAPLTAAEEEDCSESGGGAIKGSPRRVQCIKMQEKSEMDREILNMERLKEMAGTYLSGH